MHCCIVIKTHREDRKGWDLLLRAYLTEFSYADNVILYLKTNPYHNTESIQTRIEGFMQGTFEKENLFIYFLFKIYFSQRSFQRRNNALAWW